MKITSRYTDVPDVVIDAEKVPEGLRPLIPFAREWCISDDEEADAFLVSASSETRRALTQAFDSASALIEEWEARERDTIPQPDELVMFVIAIRATASARYIP